MICTSLQKQKFFHACTDIINIDRENKGIGTLSEKTLHAVLKKYYEPDINKQEIKIDRFYADIVNDNKIIEIQTRSFNKLRDKLDCFLQSYDVTVVYPIAQVKWLSWIDEETGEVTKKRKSPRQGSIYDAFDELYKIKMYLKHPNIHIKLMLLELTEYRYLNGWSKDGKKGSSRCDRVPRELLGELGIDNLADYAVFVPDDLISPFTVKDYAKIAKMNSKNAQTAINVLNHVGAIDRIGKSGRSYIYARKGESL